MPFRLVNSWPLGGACGLRLQAAARRAYVCREERGTRFFRNVGYSAKIHAVVSQKTWVFSSVIVHLVCPLDCTHVELCLTYTIFRELSEFVYSWLCEFVSTDDCLNLCLQIIVWICVYRWLSEFVSTDDCVNLCLQMIVWICVYRWLSEFVPTDDCVNLCL